MKATTQSVVNAIQVGRNYTGSCWRHKRLKLRRYHKPFEKAANIEAPFPSMPNFDLKAWEYCLSNNK